MNTNPMEHWSIYSARVRVINDLLNGVGESILHVAVQHQPPNVIKTLLDKGGRHDLRDANGDTPTHLAFRIGDLQAVRHLPALCS